MPDDRATTTLVRPADTAGAAAPPDRPDHLLDDEPRRPISPWRVLVVLVVVAAAGFGGFLGLRSRFTPLVAVPSTWFAPYVDTTATPTYQFQNVADNHARQVVLGFVVADPHAGCTPSWGGAYSEAQAAESLNLDSRVAQVRSEGAQVVVSFGGQKNTNLNVACTNAQSLAQAYESVISRYQLHTIDLDIEGDSLNDYASVRRGATAIAAVEKAERAAHTKLDVWLTLPVETNGLQDNAQSVITTMLGAHVVVAGVNVMAMDFDGLSAQPDMLAAATQALDATHSQLATIFTRYGNQLSSRGIWSHMGVTVMNGQNNNSGQLFTVDDARGLTNYASKVGLGRLSMWSLNRDAQCGSNFAETGVKSTSCSGVAQSHLQFSSVFAHLDGTVGALTKGSGVSTATVDTNPADAPYPLWVPAESYQTGYKVVREGYIYQAKWYNQGQDPASQVQFQYQTPWLLVGPVVVGDHAPVLPTLPTGTYPAWSTSQSYTAGDRVLLNGLPYQAKWDSLGASPAAEATDPTSSPWQPLFNIPGEPASS